MEPLVDAIDLEMEQKLIGSEILIDSEIKGVPIGLEMEGVLIGLEMEGMLIGSEMEGTLIGSEIKGLLIGLEMSRIVEMEGMPKIVEMEGMPMKMESIVLEVEGRSMIVAGLLIDFLTDEPIFSLDSLLCLRCLQAVVHLQLQLKQVVIPLHVKKVFLFFSSQV